eukprot:scaffold7748_cov156-Amphora_coffeaeformis.AAC.4
MPRLFRREVSSLFFCPPGFASSSATPQKRRSQDGSGPSARRIQFRKRKIVTHKSRTTIQVRQNQGKLSAVPTKGEQGFIGMVGCA